MLFLFRALRPKMACEVGVTARGRYVDTHRSLGSGAYASVRMGVLRRSSDGIREVCALKFPLVGVDIETEINILSKLKHPGVVALTDVVVSTHDGTRVMVLPYAQFDLGKYLMSQRVCYKLAMGLSRQLAEAIAYVHHQRVIHRDIKPANILLHVDGSAPCVDAGGSHVALRVWLSDFGMAREVRRRARAKVGVGRITAPMTTHVCTSWYRAPELLVATATLDQLDAYLDTEKTTSYGMSLDVWSYGAVVYEMLEGTPLAQSGSGAEAVARLLGALGPCPADCPYGAVPEWARLMAAAREIAPGRQRIPATWEVPAACLKWVPSDRMTMNEVLLLECHRTCVDAVPSTVPAPPRRPRWGATALVASGAVSKIGVKTTGQHVAAGAQERSGGTKFWHSQPTPVITSPATEQCKCTGHCNSNRHRVECCCTCRDLVAGSRYCQDCVCVVPGCVRPMNKLGMCYAHRVALDALPPPAKLAVAAAGIAQDILPVDVSDCLQLVSDMPGLLDDFPVAIAIAAVKEPTATEAIATRWKALPTAYGVDEFYSIFDAAIHAVAARAPTPGAEEVIPHSRELEQLNRQGVVWSSNFDMLKVGRIRRVHTCCISNFKVGTLKRRTLKKVCHALLKLHK